MYALQNHVFGSDKEGGHLTSDSLTMVPYISYDRTEPWFKTNRSHFHYGDLRQKERVGVGSNLLRMLGLRIIVEHPSSKGWFEILPLLFVSITGVMNLVSTNPLDIKATSMVSAFCGI